MSSRGNAARPQGALRLRRRARALPGRLFKRVRGIITTPSQAAARAAAVTARIIPLATDPDGYWNLPAFSPAGFDDTVVPPADLWRVSGGDFLEEGRAHVDGMRANLLRHGCELREAGAILDFGCGVGRMIRWLADVAEHQPVWGVDIEVPAIRWAQQHMTPPFHFTTGTTEPHLPFDDRTFGLIYAGSVFTHIEDLADAWLLELRRVTRPGGFLYLTVHDRATIDLWPTEVEEDPLSEQIRARPDLFGALGDEYAAIGHRISNNVFYDIGYLTWLCGDWLEVVEVIQGAWSHQTAIILRRPTD